MKDPPPPPTPDYMYVGRHVLFHRHDARTIALCSKGPRVREDTSPDQQRHFSKKKHPCVFLSRGRRYLPASSLSGVVLHADWLVEGGHRQRRLRHDVYRTVSYRLSPLGPTLITHARDLPKHRTTLEKTRTSFQDPNLH